MIIILLQPVRKFNRIVFRALSDIGFQITDFQIHKAQLNMIKLLLLTTGLHRNNHFITYRQYIAFSIHVMFITLTTKHDIDHSIIIKL